MMNPGTKLGGRYRLDTRIATGGMGDVWRATDEVLGREVAVKVLLPSLLNEAGFIERFRAEARMVATLTHPNIVRVYDYGESPMSGGGGVAYLVMEFIDGEALTDRLKREGRLGAAETLTLIAQAAEALHAAHSAGVIHRDVKPGNLLLNRDDTVMLTDFGIARSGLTGGLTQAGSILGTAAYVSPEQASGQTVTGQSDVYSLGIVAYQCLAGRRPWDSDNPVELVMRHVNDTPPPLPDDVPDVAKAFVMRALEKDLATRFETGSEMANQARIAASSLGVEVPLASSVPTGNIGQNQHGIAVPPLGRGLDDRTSVAPMVEPTTPGPMQRRNKILLMASAVALVLVLAVGAVVAMTLGSDNDNAKAPPADDTTTTAGNDDAADTIDIDENKYVNQPVRKVTKELEELDLKVNVVGTGNFVKSITPNGPVEPGTLITLETSNTKGDPDDDDDSEDPGDDKDCGAPICLPETDN